MLLSKVSEVRAHDEHLHETEGRTARGDNWQ
jgi:hypothetical protein